MTLKFFLSGKKKTAEIAKKRLQAMISEYKKNKIEPHDFRLLKRDILAVICKYINIPPETLNIKLHNGENNIILLEFNVKTVSVNKKKN